MLKLFRFITPMKKKIFLMMIVLILQVLGTLYIPTLTANIVNNGIMKGDIHQVYITGGLMIIIAAATSIVSMLGTYLSSYIAASLGKNIRNGLFSHAQKFSLDDFDKYGTASMITRSTSDVSVIQQTFSNIVEMLLPAPFMMIVGLTLAFSKDKMLSMLIVGSMFLLIVLIIIIGKKTVPFYEKSQKILDKMNKVLRENIIGVRVIRAFNRTQDEKEKEDKLFDEYANTIIKAYKLFALALPLIILIMNIVAVSIIWFGGQKVAGNSLQIGDIMTIIEYSTISLMYLVMAGMVFIMLPRAQTSAQRINAVLDHIPEHSVVSSKMIKYQKNMPMVEFKNVCFRYTGAEKTTLENINFQLYAGETLAIIGSTGSGKSSIAKLLLKFHTIQEGEILIHGTNINSISDDTLRKKIGFVPQKAFLFSGSIADNLRHGNPNATIEDMKKACEIAQVSDFIENLEDKYDSPVSQAGNNFSGGQKQRLAIARAIIKKPSIYIFDDSFSALDFKTDAKLRKVLKNETKKSVVMIIAQRITTILNYDKILVLDEGSIVGFGTHKELLANCPIYKQIAISQLSEEELKNER